MSLSFEFHQTHSHWIMKIAEISSTFQFVTYWCSNAESCLSLHWKVIQKLWVWLSAWMFFPKYNKWESQQEQMLVSFVWASLKDSFSETCFLPHCEHFVSVALMGPMMKVLHDFIISSVHGNQVCNESPNPHLIWVWAGWMGCHPAWSLYNNLFIN